MTSTQPFPSASSGGQGTGYDPDSPARGANTSMASSHNGGAETTRTIAILMRSAAKVHRLAITSKIASAGFTILAERLETWNTPQDDDFLSAFLACEPDEKRWIMRLTSGPIYVMLLERRRAAQTWLELVGPEDPNAHLDEDGLPLASAQQALRATYGIDNFYGSPVAGAEHQIAIAFPEFATAEALENLGLQTPADENGVEYIDSHDVVYDEQGRAYDARTGEELDLQEAYDDEEGGEEHGQPMDREQGSNPVYRALRLPKTHLKPDIEPRMSKAAALRLGIELPTVPRASRTKRTGSDASGGSGGASQQPLGISGLPLADKPLPKSLAQPTLAPRLNKAAAARLGQPLSETDSNGANGGGAARPRQAVDFSNTPGHKRNLNTSGLASLQKPAIAPRLNKATAARLGQGANGGGGVTSPPMGTGTTSRTVSGSSAASGASGSGSASGSTTATGTTAEGRPRQAVDFTHTPGHKRMSVPGMAKPASLGAPSIAPRVNKAAVARMGGAGAIGSAEEGRRASVDSVRPSASGAGTGGALRGTHGRTNSVVVSGSTAQRERQPVDFSNTPGHRRASLSLAVASLAPPSILPRSNHAAEARLAADKEKAAREQGAVRRPGSAAGGSISASRPGSSMGSHSADARPGSALGGTTVTPNGLTASASASQGGARPAKTKGAPPPSSYRMASGAAPISAGGGGAGMRSASGRV